jgi:hypothetical protein
MVEVQIASARVEAEEITLRSHVRRGIIKRGCNLCKAAKETMSVFDGFTPTLVVSSHGVVNLDGYHSLKIENGTAVILDATELAVVSLPQSGVFGYVIANLATANVQYRCRITAW